MSEKKVVTRFAPSPTGFMHVGGVRTALYAWLLARKNNGQFILRIEDTDKEREVEGSTLHIQKSLKWLGLNWDQGPDINGPHAPYIQSERLDIYKKYAQILIDKGLAYPDPYTEEVVGEYRNKAELEERPFLYREHRPENFDVWDGTKPLRFKIPEIKNYKWNDIVWGELSAGPEALDDFILIKSDGYPTYNFAHIVDDIEMGVTHVVRGQEFISSTPKFLAVYEALGVNPPAFVTTPPIMGADGKKKLGKRDGAKDIMDYEKEGYLPDAMINYLAFLGFNPGGEKEIYIREELIKAFDLSKIQRSGAQWNDEKLDWMNKEHMKLLPKEVVQNKILEYMDEDERKNPISFKLIPLILERISKWGDVKNIMKEFRYLFKETLFFSDKEFPVWKDLKNDPKKFITTSIYLYRTMDLLREINDWSYDSIKNSIWDYASKEGRGRVLWPIRVALSDQNKSPDPFKLAEILGKEETLKKIQGLINFIKAIMMNPNESKDTSSNKIPLVEITTSGTLKNILSENYSTNDLPNLKDPKKSN
ncbi:MAG: glutamate--tRNA ligase [Candidatus Paceibacterota bacterium]